jgi:hypothetical protein
MTAPVRLLFAKFMRVSAAVGPVDAVAHRNARTKTHTPCASDREPFTCVRAGGQLDPSLTALGGIPPTCCEVDVDAFSHSK